jgi:hypothetical protein
MSRIDDCQTLRPGDCYCTPLEIASAGDWSLPEMALDSILGETNELGHAAIPFNPFY